MQTTAFFTQTKEMHKSDTVAKPFCVYCCRLGLQPESHTLLSHNTSSFLPCIHASMHRQTDRETDRQRERQTDRQTDRQADANTEAAVTHLCLEALLCHVIQAGLILLQEGFTSALQMLTGEGSRLQNERHTACTPGQAAQTQATAIQVKD